MAPTLPTTTLPTTIGAPQPWPPPPTSSNSNTKTFRDCTQAICSITCPQWCNYLILPPPPPFDDGSDDSSSSSRISPLMAALIAVLSAAFLLLFYYTVISRLCRRRRNLRQLNHHDPILDPEARLDSMVQDPTRPGTGAGLDESFIRQITVFKYRRSDGLVEGTECAVCLTEFKEDESLRLMPNCEHAFHIPCIDTWLKSQSNCPLCRASMNPAPPARPVNTGPVTGPVTSVAAMRVERGGDAVLVIRELERDQVINVCHGRSGEEREGGNGEERAEERENGNGGEVRKGDC